MHAYVGSQQTRLGRVAPNSSSPTGRGTCPGDRPPPRRTTRPSSRWVCGRSSTAAASTPRSPGARGLVGLHRAVLTLSLCTLYYYYSIGRPSTSYQIFYTLTCSVPLFLKRQSPITVRPAWERCSFLAPLDLHCMRLCKSPSLKLLSGAHIW